MIGDYVPIKKRPDPVMVILAAIATAIILALFFTSKPGADQPSTHCDPMSAPRSCP